MQESMRPRLDLPDKLPRWATASGKTLEPGESDKDNGWGTIIRPPARWMNWIQNTIYEWIRRTGSVAIGTVLDVHDTLVQDTKDIIYHPDIGAWIRFFISGGVGDTESSVSGLAWSAGTAIAAQPVAAAIDSLRYIIGMTNGNIEYSVNPTFSSASTVVPGVGGSVITALETAYPDSDLIIAAGISPPYIRIASDVTAAWASATTQPTSDPLRIMRIAANSWLSINSDGVTPGDCYRSNDNGDNWALLADISSSTSLTKALCGDVNINTQTVVAGGFAGSPNGSLVYSADMGNTWQDAIISDAAAGAFNTINTVYYCGGGLWLAAGITPSISVPMWASVDDGRTWQPVTIDYRVTPIVLDDFTAISSNGRFLLAVGESGTIYKSLAIVGSPKNVTPF